MMTFEEYIETYKNFYFNTPKKHITETILKDDTIILSDLLDKLGSVDYKDVTIGAYEYGQDYREVEVLHTRTETDEEFEQRKIKKYNDYVQDESARQQREIEEYKRLKLKYEGV